MRPLAAPTARFLVPVFCLGLACAAYAESTPAGPPDDDLRAALNALQTKQDEQARIIEQQQEEIRQLRDHADRSWLSTREREEVRTLVEQVIADADRRASYLDDAILAGYDKGFYLRSADGNFSLRLLGQVQMRHVWGIADQARDDSTAPPTMLDSNSHGFELTRVRVGLKGHVIDPTWQFFVWQGFHWDGSSLLLDANIRKVLEGGWSVTAGQFKTPFLREWLVSETRQQFIERSLVSGCLCGHYTQGVMVEHQDDQTHLQVAISDGLAGINTRWDRPGVEGVAVTARGEWLLAGDWSQYADFESRPGEPVMVVLGAAGHFQQNEYGTSGTTLTTGDEAQITRWTVDASFELGGCNVFVAFVGNHQRETQFVPPLDQYGLVFQTGTFVTEDLELIARYEWGDNDIAGVKDLSVLTVGFNRFLSGHNIKLSADVGYAFYAMRRVSVGGNTFGWPSEFAGWRPDAPGGAGQIVSRVQVQLLF